MTLLRRASARQHERHQHQEVWRTGFPQGSGFGALESLHEVRLSPGMRVALPAYGEAEVFTYLREGRLSFGDGAGRRGILQAGECRRMTAPRAARPTETNASRSACAHFFEIRLRPPQADLAPGYEQKRFSTAERRGALRVLASPQACHGSLLVHLDVFVFSALLDPGQHVVHALAAQRTAWLHVVRGEVTLGDLAMSTGDGAGITDGPAVAFTACAETEVLLIDLGESPEPATSQPK
jgi:redox-sensitive bicupin YhaK (pirin superfamily)